ncbi:MAG: hypothetical protein ACOX51_10815 [Myxococcota bacterium]|jgi:hypothetical protein|nr:hypothetical protein [Myxococcota bacterium]MBP8971893.1 hypothetical protein [Myxococcota bacterium]
MEQERAEDALDHLEPEEQAQVLHELLQRHPELRVEANEIAASFIDDVCVEAVAADVVRRIEQADEMGFGHRAGRQRNGYVEPTQAAWDVLEESVEDIQTDMKRRVKAGMKRAAEKICQGILIGLHTIEGTDSDGPLGWAQDFPAETAGWTLSLLLEQYPQDQREAAGNRVILGIEDKDDGWIEMLERVVSRAVAKK